jgi:hypothetical protein
VEIASRRVASPRRSDASSSIGEQRGRSRSDARGAGGSAPRRRIGRARFSWQLGADDGGLEAVRCRGPRPNRCRPEARRASPGEPISGPMSGATVCTGMSPTGERTPRLVRGHRRTGPARITGGPADGGASCRPTDVERTAVVPSSCCRAVRFRGAEARRPRRGRPPSNPAGSHGRPRIAAPRCAQRRPSFAPTPLWAPRSRASPRRVAQPPEGVGAACRRPYPSACRLTRTAFAYRRQDVIFVFWISVTGPSGE